MRLVQHAVTSAGHPVSRVCLLSAIDTCGAALEAPHRCSYQVLSKAAFLMQPAWLHEGRIEATQLTVCMQVYQAATSAQQKVPSTNVLASCVFKPDMTDVLLPFRAMATVASLRINTFTAAAVHLLKQGVTLPWGPCCQTLNLCRSAACCVRSTQPSKPAGLPPAWLVHSKLGTPMVVNAAQDRLHTPMG